MASMPYGVQESPPGGGIYSEAAAHETHSRGSVGPLIVVLAVITILGVAAGMVGRICAGRRFRRDREYDFEAWIERKCSTCIDGSLESGNGGGGPAVPVAKPAENVEAPPDKPAEGAAPGG